MKTIKKLPINNIIDDDDIDLTGVDARTFAESMLDKDIKTLLKYVLYPVLAGFIIPAVFAFIGVVIIGISTDGNTEKVSCQVVKTTTIHPHTKSHRG